MIVQGGKTFLNNQKAKNQSSKSSSDAKSFQDLLSGAQKKKPSPKKVAKKSTNKKKTSSNSYGDEANQSLRRKDNPVRKKEVSSHIKKNEAVQSKKEEPKQAPVKMSAIEGSKVAQTKKNIQGIEKNSGAVDSLNLSGIENKTLAENEKIIKNKEITKNKDIMQAMENSFEEVMAKSQQAKVQSSNSLAVAKNAQTGTVNKAFQGDANLGKMKIDSSMDFLKTKETLSTGVDGSLSQLKVMAKDKGNLSGDNSTNLDSMLTQYMEQDVSSAEVEGTQFVEEMSLAQGESSAQKIENMQSIVKQARAFVDDGGGSMEIHLQPEGLGKVHLKVAVQEGQVNVEMTTDNLAAKKALEEGLFDIKQSLEGQKLLVETLKVEMSPDYQKDFSDLQNHMQDQANRDFAEQFLGQFRQEREERMGGLFDSFKNFQRRQDEPDLRLSRRNPYTENGKGRSVNLVA